MPGRRGKQGVAHAVEARAGKRQLVSVGSVASSVDREAAALNRVAVREVDRHRVIAAGSGHEHDAIGIDGLRGNRLAGRVVDDINAAAIDNAQRVYNKRNGNGCGYHYRKTYDNR